MQDWTVVVRTLEDWIVVNRRVVNKTLVHYITLVLFVKKGVQSAPNVGMFLIMKVARHIWIVRLDFHMYP